MLMLSFQQQLPKTYNSLGIIIKDKNISILFQHVPLHKIEKNALNAFFCFILDHTYCSQHFFLWPKSIPQFRPIYNVIPQVPFILTCLWNPFLFFNGFQDLCPGSLCQSRMFNEIKTPFILFLIVVLNDKQGHVKLIIV